jgi:hypothetical protein
MFLKFGKEDVHSKTLSKSSVQRKILKEIDNQLGTDFAATKSKMSLVKWYV